jgi:ABC-type transporter Mla MlaB component
MSKQWWKGKQDGAAPEGAGFPVAAPASDASVDISGQFATTQGAGDVNAGAEFTETQMGAGMAPPDSVASSTGGSDRYANPDVGFSASKLFASEVDEMATDPELEEAAIRFANGDDTGAESGLLEALRGDAIQPEAAQSWAAALFDFYRATDNRAKFDAALAEFGFRFDSARPVWASIPNGEGRSSSVSSSSRATDESHSGRASGVSPHWDCPAELTLAAMETLREVMSTQPMPWHLGWSRLTRIDPDAMALLGGLFSSLCDEPVSLRFSGGASLVQTLRTMLPSGDRSVNPDWWTVRLNVLRTMQLIDEFELAALDYCVTFEVSPPAWQDARCRFESAAPGVPDRAEYESYATAATEPMGLGGAPGSGLELRGDVLGDATQALQALAGNRVPGERIIVSCHGLIRVDFSAAGSILNWVAMRQAEGCLVQFRDVHRLVAAFFNVIGINEHAQVTPRSI